ncbi:MAG TPA: sigma-70 family RNA polymerase sigma factor [Burkholderiaceae bacterium]|nr:sigma-70 family RNA polymerase sigma factor [Burkholderiaceae bacterium]
MAFDPPGRAASFAARTIELSGTDEIDEGPELRSALSGDEAAFTAIYRRHHAVVYRFAWLLTGSAAQAADIMQDVFVELLSVSTGVGYDPVRGSLAAYLCGIARFRAYRAIDARMQSVGDIDALIEAHAGYEAPPLPCDRLERSRALRTLYDAIRQLPPIFRDVLILVELQQMSYADAAAIVGIELGTVRSRLSRAKAKLAQLLNDRRTC